MAPNVKSEVFILTGEWRDVAHKHVLVFYGSSPEHSAVEVRIDTQRPVFFVERTAALPECPFPLERKALPLKNFAHKDVDALYFTTQRDLRAARDICRRAGIRTYEADLRPIRRFLMERFVNTQMRLSGPAEMRGGCLCFHNPHIEACEVRPRFRVASIDIETGVESGRLYSIAVHVFGREQEDKRVFMLAEKEAELPEGITFLPDERRLLQGFLDYVRAADPDIIIGWNVISFDLKFLDDKCRELGMDFAIGRGGKPPRLRRRNRGGYAIDLRGRIVIDGPQTLRYAFYTFEDFSLETVAQELLHTGKTIKPEQDKIAEIERMFAHDKVGLARYNLEDCVLVSRIFAKTGLLELCVTRARISGLMLDEVGLSVAAFDHYMLPRLHRKGFVAPNLDDVEPQGHAAGGYIFEPQAGIHDNVIVLDFKSLYPSIIQSFNIDPLAHLQSHIEPLETPAGIRFSATESILPAFIEYLMQQRSEAKHRGDSHLSHAIKILMNSFYGVMGSYGCRFYHPDLPSAITGTGQWLLQGSRRFFESQGYIVVYGDTDSVFVKLPEGQDPDSTGKALARELNEYWNKALSDQFGRRSYLEIEYERHYHKLVLLHTRHGSGGAKKRYAGLLTNKGEATMEFVGMEYVRTDWTVMAKEFQYELYLRLLTGREYKQWLCDFVDKVRRGAMDHKLVYRKRLRKNAEDYTKNVSPQVKAARMLSKPVREVRYLMTRTGPVPLELHPTGIDYRHYIDKQLRPIADSLLNLEGSSFNALIARRQWTLFDPPGDE